ncbi:MAG: response regulator [Chloroflexi bacterium]|nr:response regulator [Chloroflexota bacterium]
MARILIAEDEPDIRELIAFLLELEGHEVLQAQDGLEAVEQARREKPDFILLDVRMPRMTGYEACRIIKQDPALGHIPVVFLSAKGQEAEVQAGYDAGADAYLLKPFEAEDLIQTVNRFVGQA